MGIYADLVRPVRRAIQDARAGGRDYLGQSEHAIRTVLRVRPDMSLSDASTVVNEIRTTCTCWSATRSPQPGT